MLLELDGVNVEQRSLLSQMLIWHGQTMHSRRWVLHIYRKWCTNETALMVSIAATPSWNFMEVDIAWRHGILRVRSRTELPTPLPRRRNIVQPLVWTVNPTFTSLNATIVMFHNMIYRLGLDKSCWKWRLLDSKELSESAFCHDTWSWSSTQI